MVPAGLTRRLHQHSRRGGIAVGLSMLVAATLLFGGFVVIYGALEPYTRDFVAADVPDDPTPSPGATAPPAADGGADEPTAPAVDEPTPEGDQPGPTPTATTGAVPTQDDDAEFEPDYQVDPGAGTGINLRTTPSIAGGQTTVIVALPPGTALEFQGEEQQDSENPAENGTWLLFQTEDGQEGWIREIDVVQI